MLLWTGTWPFVYSAAALSLRGQNCHHCWASTQSWNNPNTNPSEWDEKTFSLILLENMFTMQQFGESTMQMCREAAHSPSKWAGWVVIGALIYVYVHKKLQRVFVKAVFTAFMMHNHSWLQVLERVQTIFLFFCFRNCETVNCKIFWVMTS